MSKISLSGNASGTGTLTIAAPNTNTDRTLTLPDNTGTIVTTGSSPSFPTTIGVGDATPAASGAGITFPATQSASSDANTLDDYEDGTWTPGISFGGASAGVTYDGTNTFGTYTKIGRAVFYRGAMVLTNKGSSTGQVRITGLPFTVASNGWSPSAIGNLLDVTYTQDINAYAEASTTTIVFWNSGSGNRQSFTNSGVTNSSQFMVSGVYFV